jgi:multicomponent Na+:H+ antiporter subunit G
VNITAPVAAHLISRSAYLTGVRLWDRTIADELEGRYDLNTDTLRSTSTAAAIGTDSKGEDLGDG